MKLANATIYRSMLGTLPAAEDIDAAMQLREFVPTTATQERSVGWIAPREAHGALIEAVAGQWIAKLMIETRSVPSSAVKRAVAKRCADIEKTTGRKPGRKERKEIKADALIELLPHAFPKQSAVSVWIDPKAGTVVFDTPSQSKADDVATALVRVFDGLALSLFNTKVPPATAMAHWLLDADALPAGFTIDRDAELHATDGSKAVIKYTNHPLDTDEVRGHIESGFVPAKLAMTWEGRVSFVITEGMTIRSLAFLEGTMDANDIPEDEFDANVAISTGEVSRLIAALVEALGGEQQMTIAQAGEGAAASGPAPHVDGHGPDPMLDQAKALVINEQKASISLVQRHLQIGYNRAARLIESLEKIGVVSGMSSVGVRTVLRAAA